MAEDQDLKESKRDYASLLGGRESIDTEPADSELENFHTSLRQFNSREQKYRVWRRGITWVMIASLGLNGLLLTVGVLSKTFGIEDSVYSELSSCIHLTTTNH